MYEASGSGRQAPHLSTARGRSAPEDREDGRIDCTVSEMSATGTRRSDVLTESWRWKVAVESMSTLIAMDSVNFSWDSTIRMSTHKGYVSFHFGLFLFSDSFDFIFCCPILTTMRYCRSLCSRHPTLGRSASITMARSVEINVQRCFNRRSCIPLICEISNVSFPAG